jgi:hypothetical protein
MCGRTARQYQPSKTPNHLRKTQGLQKWKWKLQSKNEKAKLVRLNLPLLPDFQGMSLVNLPPFNFYTIFLFPLCMVSRRKLLKPLWNMLENFFSKRMVPGGIYRLMIPSLVLVFLRMNLAS